MVQRAQTEKKRGKLHKKPHLSVKLKEERFIETLLVSHKNRVKNDTTASFNNWLLWFKNINFQVIVEKVINVSVQDLTSSQEC